MTILMESVLLLGFRNIKQKYLVFKDTEVGSYCIAKFHILKATKIFRGRLVNPKV